MAVREVEQHDLRQEQLNRFFTTAQHGNAGLARWSHPRAFCRWEGRLQTWSATRTTAVRAMTYAERHSHRWSAREPSMPGGTTLPGVARGAACRTLWSAGMSSATRAA